MLLTRSGLVGDSAWARNDRADRGRMVRLTHIHIVLSVPQTAAFYTRSGERRSFSGPVRARVGIQEDVLGGASKQPRRELHANVRVFYDPLDMFYLRLQRFPY